MILRKASAILCALGCLICSGCKHGPAASLTDLQQTIGEAGEQSSSGIPEADAEPVTPFSVPELSDSDRETGYDDTAVRLAFDGLTVTPSVTDGITVENGTVTLKKGGTYVLTGSLDNGRVIVNPADAAEKVHLICMGVTLHSDEGAPLTIMKADKAVITLCENTVNTFSDAERNTDSDGDSEQSAKACLISKCDLTINGTGALTVSANAKNGIHCKNDLKLVSGRLQVNAKNNGIRSNSSVLIHDGVISVQAEGDGIKTTDTENKGYIVIEGGSVDVKSAQDGIAAASDLYLMGGSVAVESGGGAENAEPHQPERNMPGRGERAQQNTETAENSVSKKGVKAGGKLSISGGSLLVNSADDSVHSDGTAVISGDAVLQLSSGDDGIHADTALSVAGNASVSIAKSYEGMESEKIAISGGSIRIKASDDGLNAAGKQTESTGNTDRPFGRAGSTGTVAISGGYLFVNADGDGIDSNGDISMTGGTVTVCGPTNNGNGPLDRGDNGNTITVTGGTLLAVGSTGMMDCPERCYLAATDLNAAADTLIAATDKDGNVLAVLKTPKQAAGAIISANGMEDGYSIYKGGTYSGELNSDGFAVGGSITGGTLVKSGSGGAPSRFGGPGGKDRGERPEGFDPRGRKLPGSGDSMPDGMVPPDGFRNPGGDLQDFPGGGFGGYGFGQNDA